MSLCINPATTGFKVKMFTRNIGVVDATIMLNLFITAPTTTATALIPGIYCHHISPERNLTGRRYQVKAIRNSEISSTASK
jgi:hypothetical protein